MVLGHSPHTTCKTRAVSLSVVARHLTRVLCALTLGAICFSTHLSLALLLFLGDIRDIRKVRKTQHQYPEFGHTQGQFFKKPAKKSTLAFKGRVKLKKPSILMVPEFPPVFLLS
jgi:hypothetical protein